MKELTARRREVFEYIKGYIHDNGQSPTVRQVGKHFGFAPKAAYDHIKALIRKGYVERGHSGARDLRILKEKGPVLHLTDVPKRIAKQNRDALIVPVMDITDRELILRDEAVIAKRFISGSDTVDVVALRVNQGLDTQACASVNDDDLLFVARRWTGTLDPDALVVTESRKVMPFSKRRGQAIFGKVVYLQRVVAV